MLAGRGKSVQQPPGLGLPHQVRQVVAGAVEVVPALGVCAPCQVDLAEHPQYVLADPLRRIQPQVEVAGALVEPAVGQDGYSPVLHAASGGVDPCHVFRREHRGEGDPAAARLPRLADVGVVAPQLVVGAEQEVRRPDDLHPGVVGARGQDELRLAGPQRRRQPRRHPVVGEPAGDLRLVEQGEVALRQGLLIDRYVANMLDDLAGRLALH